MLEIDDIQAGIKEHLLGRVKGEERERFEEQFLTDPEFREIVLLIEGELLDDYAAGLLSDDDRASFINHYVNAPSRKKELQFTAALRDQAIEDFQPKQTKPEFQRSEHSIWKSIGKKRWIPVLVSAGLAVAALILNWSAISQWIFPNRVANFSAQVALLNKQPAKNEPTFPIELRLIQGRAPGDQPKAAVPPGTSVVELQAHLPERSYASYQATLRVVNGGEVFNVRELQAGAAQDGKTLRLRIPPHVLTPQDYIFSIKGVTAEGDLEELADYYFRIVKQ